MMLEPAVTLTDYAIALECGILAGLLHLQKKSSCRTWFVLLFVFIAAAALLGGTVHGFLPDPATHIYTALWGATLVSIGVVALAAAMAAANSGWGKTVRRSVLAIAILFFAAYCNELIFVGQEYRLAISVYLPAMGFLFVSFIANYVRGQVSVGRTRWLTLVGATGVLLTFCAAGIQQSQLALAGLDHNALYHIVQGVALIAIYAGALGVMRLNNVLRS